MTFADPHICLSCRGPIEAGMGSCPHCGMDLASPEIQQAWRSLVVADQWVIRARMTNRADPVKASAMVTPSGGPALPPPRRRLTAGSVLLAIGAISLLVAGLIFITVSWGSMGIIGRALLLLLFTAVVGFLARLVTRRALRGSAEALWAVFLGLVSLDWFAGRDQGLLGLDAIPTGHAVGLWGLIVLVAGIAIVRGGRPVLGRDLTIPAIAAGVAPVAGAVGVAAEIWESAFWSTLVPSIAAVLVAVLLRRLGVQVGRWTAAALAAILGAVAIGAAVVEALEHPGLRQLVVQGHGVPLLVLSLAAVGVARVSEVARSLCTTICVLSLVLLVAIPAESSWELRGGYLVTGAAAFVLAVRGAGEGRVNRGLQWAACLAAGLVASASVPWIVQLIAVTKHSMFMLGSPMLDVGPWWMALYVSIVLSATVLATQRWREMSRVNAHVRAIAAAVLALGATATVAALHPAPILFGASLVVIAGGLSAVAQRSPAWWPYVGPVAVALVPFVTLSSWSASAFVWPMAAIVLGIIARRATRPVFQWLGLSTGVWWVCGTVGAAVQLAGDSDRTTALAVIIAAVVALAAVSFADRSPGRIGPGECGAAAAGAFGLILGIASGLAALPWTIAGAGVAAVGLSNSRRRSFIKVGSVLLGIAYVVRLADAGVDVVEAYTAPFAVVLLAAGAWALRRPGLSTLRALGPGVTLALLPSLPHALNEPTSLRALLLGLVALALLAVGVKRRWQAPFVGGAVTALLLVVANIGPWALGLERWILIAVVGMVALAVGATWEARARQGRAAVSYVSSMR
jgi:hypothetical protein